MMTPDEYRAATLSISRTSATPLDGDEGRLALYGLGIAGEAGEVADEIDRQAEPRDRLQRRQHHGRAGHVGFHVLHRGRRLQRQARRSGETSPGPQASERYARHWRVG